MNMKYKDLLYSLLAMTDVELAMNVSIYDENSDEWYLVSRISRVQATDVLDEGHPYLETAKE